jgi:hypothetical protein
LCIKFVLLVIEDKRISFFLSFLQETLMKTMLQRVFVVEADRLYDSFNNDKDSSPRKTLLGPISKDSFIWVTGPRQVWG